MAIHQLTPAFTPGDAIGNQAAAIRTALRSWGIESQVYSQRRDPNLTDAGEDYRKLKLGKGDWLIYHHGIDSAVTPTALKYLDRLIFVYHNITPVAYLRGYNDHLAGLAESGRRQLIRFRDAPIVWSDSEYNAAELRSLGFRDSVIMPLRVDTAGLQASAASPEGQHIVALYPKAGGPPVDVARPNAAVNWLFVGRIAPNKRQDALVRAFNYYQRLVNPRARLLLVGLSLYTPGYQIELESLTWSLELSNKVILAGAPSLAKGFGGYYAAANVFVCASEHEGFCVPVVEAMSFSIPVVAYGSTGVRYAVGDAGLLVSDNTPATLAEAVDWMLNNAGMQNQFRARQQARVAAFGQAQFEMSLQAEINRIVGGLGSITRAVASQQL
ncbi:MAG: glycosyltransferase family 4 protein [Chloroflexi bacterium]|nr:glycosyltransferase family 4 protein [Chloroflexota bacterium]MCL5275880.1 glycosyltransferase family 4 protein [Chloroflexota bacterium]